MSIYKILFYIKSVTLFVVVGAFSQSNTDLLFSDNGILRWTDSKEEAAFFGVNYSTPFAHAYRSIEKLGLSHKEAIDMDVTQMARLELDAYRIHVWDREVSDSLGNLLDNEHLNLLDYLIHRLKEKNIKILLTPIAWWGTGWPEADPPTPGFSSFNSKSELITRPAARKAQVNYLTQFLNHKNAYTGQSYKADPDIIAFEIINEPGHPSDTAMVTAYINEMAAVIRAQGVTKPVYYNISQNWSDEQAAAVYRANIDGISFQWYPSGLVKNSELTGNYLAHVDHYPVPEIDDTKFKNKTRMVYEFDAADIAQSVMYPAMARSFREAGMQWATMFSYDPSFMASYNTEYNTHYLNLLYTPQKAISLMIAANVFRTLKTYQKLPSYPENRVFAGSRISYENNLAELNTGEKFYYSNTTDSDPLNPQQLKHIAGYGSSKLVKTDATGAYFLDKIEKDTWRLELYPDVIKLTNPFGRNSLDRRVRRLVYNNSSVTLNLPGLEDAYLIQSVTGKGWQETAKEGRVSIKPGVYVISNTLSPIKDLKYNYRNLTLDSFPVKAEQEAELQVLDNSPRQIFAGQAWPADFQVISDSRPDTVILYTRQPGWRGFRPLALKHKGKNRYGTDITENISNGVMQYCVFVKASSSEMTFPAKVGKNPNAWDYFPDETWQLKIVPKEASLVLFDPAEDMDNLIYPGFWGRFRMQSSAVWDQQQDVWYNLELYDFRRPAAEFVLQVELDDKADSIKLSDYRYVQFDINLHNSTVEKFRFQLINSAYEVLEQEIILDGDEQRIMIPLKDFTLSEFVLLPRPYPHFLPYSFRAETQIPQGVARTLNFIQIKIPFEKKMESEDRLKLQISAVKLVR